LPNARLAEAFPLLYESVYGTSRTVAVNVAPALTIKVKDATTKKPISGAIILADTNTATTDETGTATFELLPLGTYTVKVTHPAYMPKTGTVTITEAGALKEVTLWPYWIIPAGIGGAFALVTLVYFLTKPRR
jgi:hypothetical protein